MNFTNYLSSIQGVDIYPIMSFIAFFTFFICMSWWAIRADKRRIKTMSELPFNSGETNSNINQTKN